MTNGGSYNCFKYNHFSDPFLNNNSFNKKIKILSKEECSCGIVAILESRSINQGKKIR